MWRGSFWARDPIYAVAVRKFVSKAPHGGIKEILITNDHFFTMLKDSSGQFSSLLNVDAYTCTLSPRTGWELDPICWLGLTKLLLKHNTLLWKHILTPSLASPLCCPKIKFVHLQVFIIHFSAPPSWLHLAVTRDLIPSLKPWQINQTLTQILPHCHSFLHAHHSDTAA